MARAAVASAIGVALATAAPTVAGAQSASGAQYGNGSSVTDPSLVAGANEDAGSSNGGSSSSGSDSGSSDSGSNGGSSGAAGGGGAAGAGGGSAGGGAAGTGAGAGTTSAVSAEDANRISIVTFGTAQRDLADDVREALAAAGLQTLTLDASTARLKAFLDGPLASQLSDGGAQAVGQAVGAQLVTSSDLAGRVFTSLFGSGKTPRPLTRAVLSRPENPDATLDAFTKGLARGFAAAGITVVFVERTDTKDSVVSEYRKIPGVGTVANLDTSAGKKRLAELITGGGTGTIGAAADPVSVDGKRVSATKPGGDSDDALLYGLVGVTVLGAGAFAGTGVARRRRQG